MAVGCGATCAKVILITFNFLFWLSGVALLVLGIWILADDQVENHLLVVEGESAIMTKYLAYALIGIGALVFLIGFLGCCGALKENKCLLGLYLFFLIIIAGAEIAAGVLGFIHKTNIEDKIGATLENKWNQYYNGNANTSVTIKTAIDAVEHGLKCCNYVTISEKSSQAAQNHCKRGDGTKLKGCLEKLRDWIKQNAPILIGVACGFGGLEIFGIICAICLCRAVGEKDD